MVKLKEVIGLIKIHCERDYLAGWEKTKYAKAMRVIIKQLREFQATIKEEKGIEINCLIIIK
ncbi:MAG: hypothetical protein L6254_03985 [Candidatus Omnitrophica bacterium]|nr:hypothetical protein [Candidatus Omnitrophota bacterium]